MLPRYEWGVGGDRIITAARHSQKETGAWMIPIPSEQVSLLAQHYTLREPAGVLAFLEKAPFLVPLLLEAHPQIKRSFPGSPVFLEVSVDPEGEEPEKLLAAIQITGLSAHEAVDRLHQFDQRWWLSVFRRVQGKLIITME